MQAELRTAFDAAVANVANPARKAELKTRFDAAETANDDGAMARLLGEASFGRHWSSTLWSMGTLLLVFVAVGAFVYGIGSYFESLPKNQWTDIASVRPILVLSLIMSMLGFGALLISRPLFMTGSAEEIEKKFQMSREIFLVFSGVFATVIGFYFGSSTTQPPASPLAVAQAVETDGTIVVVANGPDGPYSATINLKGGGSATFIADEDQPGTLRLAVDAALACPSDGTLLITSKASETAQWPVTVTRAQLTAWPQCGDGEAAPPVMENATN